MNKLSTDEIKRVHEASLYLGTVTPSVLEKDIFVTHAIHAVSEIKHPEINLVFCGGTCLAKGHQIIQRMSEDIDFKIYSISPFLSHSAQRRKLGTFRDEITFLLKSVGFELNKNNIRCRDNNSYMVYHLDYPSHFTQHYQLKPHIQLEFTLSPPRLPLELKTIATMVDRLFPEDGLHEKNIKCISILETAIEKWVGLTRRVAAIARGHDPMDGTLVRHIYDLHIITQQIYFTDDFLKLAEDTINRDRDKFKRHPEYIADPCEEINYSLKALDKDPRWTKDYDNFVESMVFAKESADFKQCYEKLKNLTEQILCNLNLSRTTV